MYKEAEKRIKPVKENPLQAFVTDKFQLFDSLEVILREIGAVDLVITSFSVSEEFIRKIHLFRERGLIRSCSVVIDTKAAAKVSQLLNFAGNVFDNVYLGNNHSKIVLMAGDHVSVSIITSQNLTRGNRMESTVITTDTQTFYDLTGDVDIIIGNAVKICTRRNS